MNFSNRARRAFSWLEVLIVIAVLGTAAAVYVPSAKYLAHKSRVGIIESRLQQMARDGRAYVVSKGVRRTTYATLVREKVFPPAEPILGESYDHLIFEHVGGVLTVNTADGDAVMVRY